MTIIINTIIIIIINIIIITIIIITAVPIVIIAITIISIIIIIIAIIPHHSSCFRPRARAGAAGCGGQLGGGQGRFFVVGRGGPSTFQGD